LICFAITMSLDIESVELALFTGRWNNQISSFENTPVGKYAKYVVDGSFRSVLTCSHAQTVFKVVSSSWGFDQPVDSWFTLTDPLDVNTEQEGELLRLIFAVACLHAFIQANWTGPDLDVTPLDVLVIPSTAAAVSADALNQKATSELAYGGEPAYHLARVPIFLRLADVLLSVPAYRHCRSVRWWRLRTWMVRQRVLDEPVALPSQLLSSWV
jgi:hypothetical protein